GRRGARPPRGAARARCSSPRPEKRAASAPRPPASRTRRVGSLYRGPRARLTLWVACPGSAGRHDSGVREAGAYRGWPVQGARGFIISGVREAGAYRGWPAQGARGFIISGVREAGAYRGWPAQGARGFIMSWVREAGACRWWPARGTRGVMLIRVLLLFGSLWRAAPAFRR